MEKENEFVITEELVRGEAENCLDRELTNKEMGEVFEAIQDEWAYFIQDRINEVIDFNKMLKRNKSAKTEPIHFDLYHRNKNAYKPQFELMGSFKSEADAREFAHHDFITEFDEWKLVRVFGSDETIIWAINIK